MSNYINNHDNEHLPSPSANAQALGGGTVRMRRRGVKAIITPILLAVIVIKLLAKMTNDEMIIPDLSSYEFSKIEGSIVKCSILGPQLNYILPAVIR